MSREPSEDDEKLNNEYKKLLKECKKAKANLESEKKRIVIRVSLMIALRTTLAPKPNP